MHISRTKNITPVAQLTVTISMTYRLLNYADEFDVPALQLRDLLIDARQMFVIDIIQWLKRVSRMLPQSTRYFKPSQGARK